MSENDIENLFHQWSGQKRSDWERLARSLPESERADILILLDSDARLQSEGEFLKPKPQLITSTDVQTQDLENTVGEDYFKPKPEVDVPDQIRDYRILNVIAVHGQGIVYRADHTRLNRQVVIKVVQDTMNEAARLRWSKKPAHWPRFRIHTLPKSMT